VPVKLIIRQSLPLETIAIVEATAPDVTARQAAIIFRAWHHLETEPARRLLFEQFTLDGHVVGLLDAIVSTARSGRWTGAASFLPLLRQDRESFDATLEGALIGALRDVLGASIMVVNAWREAFRFFLHQLRPAPQL
jgi:hemoglobin-like flavoprotein